MSIISDSMLRNNDSDRASAQYASSQPYSQTYSDEGSSSDNQQGLLERIFNGLEAASDWIGNNVEYVENSPVGQWIGNNVECVENSPVGQAVGQVGQVLAPANSIFRNWPALLGLAANAAVTPKDNDTFSGSLYDAGVNGAANTVGSIADLMHQDDLAAAMYTLANKTQDNTPVQADWDWDYITNPHGLTRSFGNAIGSMAPLLPAAALAPESLVAAAGRLSPWLANGVRYGFTAIPEAMAEGGQTRREAIEDGLNHPDLRAFGTLAKNLPLLAVSNTLEGAILGGGLGKMLAGKAGEGVLSRVAKAPFRATLSALAEGLQNGLEEGLQQGIQNASVDKEYGYLPWNWTGDQWDAAKEGFFGTLPLGGIGDARKAIFPGVGGVVTAPENGPDNTDPVVMAQLTGKNDDVPTADGVDVTNLDPQQYTQWYGEKLKSQGIDVPDATITVQTPKATGTTGGAKAGAGANVMDAAQDFMGQHMENGANGCVEAVTKIGARYSPFLADELSKGVVNVDTLVADAGDKVIPFDPNNLEAGDVIVYGDNDHVVLADGNGGYVGNSSSQQKVVQGGNYNEMGDLKPTKIIKTGNGVTAQNETANNGGASAADLSSLPVGDIATAIAQNTGLPANFIWAQLSHESDGGNSKLAREDHNYGGVKGNDGEYLHFDNDQQFIDYMSDYYPKYREDGIYDAKTADQFAEALQHGGYFTAGIDEYEGGMHRYLEQAGLSDSGTAGAPSEKQSNSGDNANTMTAKQFGDMLNEKMIDFAGTNDDTVRTVFNDMSTSKDKALVSLFAPYMQDGVFANTAANRAALANDDGFKKAMSMFLSKHLSDYAPAFENGRISFQQAEDALRPRHQVQAAQTAQAVQATKTPNIQTTASPQAVMQMVNKGLSQAQQQALLKAADTALHTPQGMANGDEMAFMNNLSQAVTEHDYPTIAQMIPNEAAQALSIPKQVALKNTTSAATNQVKPAEAMQANMSVNQPPAHTDNRQAEQQAAPKEQTSVTPLPTQEAQRSEGVRIAQPQPAIDEQNAQMDARIAEIKKQPLAQRKALGQQYLDTLRQNNVPFSEKKLAKPLMDGEPKAIEHVQRTYGDLLNTITPAESAAASQHTAPRTIQAATTARLANMVGEITSGNTYKNASPVGKLAYLAAASGHAKTVGADESVKAIDSIINDVRKKAGFSGKGTTEGMTPAQKDEFYNTFYKQSLDDATAIRKEAQDEKPANLKSLDNTIEMFKQELAKSKPTKEERKEVTHESTQSKSQNEPDKGTKNQDQHANPEPRKTADTQREAEESEVSTTKKAADEGGKYVLADGYRTESGKPLSESGENEFILKPNGSKDFGEITDAISKAAKEQSGVDLAPGKICLRVGNDKEGLLHAKKHEEQAKADGYTSIEDMIADVAENFDAIYERPAKKTGDRPTYSLIKYGDKKKDKMNGTAPVYFDLENDGSGNYYLVITAIPTGDKSLARQTKKDRLIYSNSGLGVATTSNSSAVSRPRSENVGATKGVRPTSDKSSGPSTHIIPHEQKEGTKNLDTGNHHEMVEKHSQNGDTVDVVLEAQRDGVPSNLADYVRDVTREDVASIPDERNAFLQEAEALLSDGKASAKGSVADMVQHIEFPESSALTTREKAMQEFGQQMGVKVVFFDGPTNLRGFYNKGITFINRSASKSPSWVFWHENLHWLRSNNPELYRQMVDYISGRQEFAPEQLQAYRDAIGRPELTDADAIEEMLADAMPDVHKRVGLFRKMGRENKSLIQRFFGWLRDTMAAFHNAFSQPKYGLSKSQAQAMRDALANIADDLRDGEGRRIFRTCGADREILTAQGEELSYPMPDDDTRYSADGRDEKPAGSPGMIRRALAKLVDVKTLDNVEVRHAKGKQLDDISGFDMLAKSVRQVARKSPAIQYVYRLGRKVLDEQEHLRNFYAQEMKRFNKYVKNPKVLKETAQLLLDGDALGHAYTGDELEAMGVSADAGRAYNLARKLLADAFKRVNDARMQVTVRTNIVSRNNYAEFLSSHFLKPDDVLKTDMLHDGSLRVTYRGAKVYEKKDVTVSPAEFNNLNKDKDVYITYDVQNNDGTHTIGYTERVKPIHNLEGYMPHFFHKFMVYEKTTGDDGKEILVSLGSANSLKKAADLANKYAAANPKGQFVIRPHSFEYDENYNNVVVGDKDYTKMMMQITKHTEMTLPEANKFLHDNVGVTKKNRHRFFGNAMHRKGAKGFDQDVQWALTHYLNASARYVAMEHFKPEAISFYERFFGDFNADPKSNTARYIKNYINDMNGVPSWIEEELNKIVDAIPILGPRLSDAFEGRSALALSSSISWFNAVTKLGLGNFASAAINFMQFVNIGTRLNSYAYANMGLKKAIHLGDADRRIIDESGVLDEVNLSSDAGGYTQRRDYGRVRSGFGKVKRGLDYMMIPFTKADTLMREAAILGAYYQGVKEMHMSHEKALAYAKEVNYDANFDYSTAAAPGAMRAGSVLTQQLFQFQKYPIMQFEFFWNNVVHAKDNKQRARFLVPYLLLSGAVGAVPFGGLINALASTLAGVGGDDDNDLAEEIKAEMMKWAGTDPMKRRLVNTALYGILANANINISERVGMSNAFSGEYYGDKPQSSAGALVQALGGPLVSTVYNVAKQAANHNPIETIKAVSPSLGNILQAIVGETRTTHHRVGTVYEDAYSRVMHALGFRSVDETNNSFVNSYLYNQQKQEREDRKDAMDAYIRNPSSENHQRMVDLGIKDSTFKTYKENANKSSKERSQGEKKTKSKKPQTASQKEDTRLKDFTK